MKKNTQKSQIFDKSKYLCNSGDIPDPWADIKDYDQSHGDRTLISKEKWEEGRKILTTALLMAIISDAVDKNKMLEYAHSISWGLPLETLDTASRNLDALLALHRLGGFVIETRNGPKMAAFRSKSEAAKFLISSPYTRKPTQEEIDEYIFDLASETVR